MAIVKKLEAKNNYLNMDFPNAYWRIENAGIEVNDDGTVMCGFDLNIYANAYSKQTEGQNVEQLVFNGIKYGGSRYPYVNGLLYTWGCRRNALEIFPSGIPTSRDEQLTAYYNWLKTELGLTDYVDV